jgi:hypothetical protein
MTHALPQTAKPDPRKAARERRLALALRENLAKRKDQERQRKQAPEQPENGLSVQSIPPDC